MKAVERLGGQESKSRYHIFAWILKKWNPLMTVINSDLNYSVLWIDVVRTSEKFLLSFFFANFLVQERLLNWFFNWWMLMDLALLMSRAIYR
jgi:hypothetical protein